jgi:hypothetical protein
MSQSWAIPAQLSKWMAGTVDEKINQSINHMSRAWIISRNQAFVLFCSWRWHRIVNLQLTKRDMSNALLAFLSEAERTTWQTAGSSSSTTNHTSKVQLILSSKAAQLIIPLLKYGSLSVLCRNKSWRG